MCLTFRACCAVQCRASKDAMQERTWLQVCGAVHPQGKLAPCLSLTWQQCVLSWSCQYQGVLTAALPSWSCPWAWPTPAQTPVLWAMCAAACMRIMPHALRVDSARPLRVTFEPVSPGHQLHGCLRRPLLPAKPHNKHTHGRRYGPSCTPDILRSWAALVLLP
jgi:hypothetical protein